MIKFLDLYGQYQTIEKEIDGAISRVIKHSSFIGGEEVYEFEKGFAAFQQAKYCVGVGNGTDALEIVLEALDLPEKSEVIVPANSFIASSEAVTRAGYRVVFADVDSSTYTLDPDDVLRRITPKTSAIIAVHLYGHPCKMNTLIKIAHDHQLKLIEDCAQAHGAEFEGKRVGSIGDASTFSFYPGKNLGAYGDAGAILTNNEVLEKKCRMIANHGRTGRYDHQFEGRNSRLDGLQAAILRVKLNYLEDWINRRNDIAVTYYENLKSVSQIMLPIVAKDCRHAFHLYVIRTKMRDELKKYLIDKGIQTGIHYPIALPKLAAYTYLKQGNEEMFANKSDDTLLSLPIGEHLTTEEVYKVSEVIKSFFII